MTSTEPAADDKDQVDHPLGELLDDGRLWAWANLTVEDARIVHGLVGARFLQLGEPRRHSERPRSVQSFGKKRQGFDVARPNDWENSAIECGDFSDPEPFAQCDHRRVGGAQLKALAVEDELRSALVVLPDEFDWPQCSIGQRGQELRFDPGATLAGEQVADLGDDRTWHQNLPGSQMQGRE